MTISLALTLQTYVPETQAAFVPPLMITAPGSTDNATPDVGETATITAGTATPSGDGVITYEVRHLIDGAAVADVAAYTYQPEDAPLSFAQQWRAVETGGTNPGTTAWQTVASGAIAAVAPDIAVALPASIVEGATVGEIAAATTVTVSDAGAPPVGPLTLEILINGNVEEDPAIMVAAGTDVSGLVTADHASGPVARLSGTVSVIAAPSGGATIAWVDSDGTDGTFRITTDQPGVGAWHWALVALGAAAPVPDGAGGWSGTVLESGTLAVGQLGDDIDIPETGTTGVTYQMFLYQRAGADSNVISTTFVADNDAPALSNPQFFVDAGSGEFTMGVDEACTFRAVVTNSATAPTAAQIGAQTDHLDAPAAFYMRADPTGPGSIASPQVALGAGAWHLHFFAVDLAGNDTGVQTIAAQAGTGNFVDEFAYPDGTLLKDTDNWTETVSGNYDILVQGGVTQDNAVRDNLVNDDRAVFLANFNTGDASAIEVEVNSFSGASNKANFLLFFRYTDPDNYLGVRFDGGTFTIIAHLGGADVSAGGSGTHTLQPGDLLRVECINKSLTIYINNVQVGGAWASAWTGIETGGGLGIRFESRRKQDPDIPSIRRFEASNL